jgi:hypothetical protein
LGLGNRRCYQDFQQQNLKTWSSINNFSLSCLEQIRQAAGLSNSVCVTDCQKGSRAEEVEILNRDTMPNSRQKLTEAKQSCPMLSTFVTKQTFRS